MKKIISLIVVSFVIFATLFIYSSFEDKDIYYLALGDSLAVGTNSFGEDIYGYTDYIKDYLKKQNKLEIFVKEYAKNGYKINDLMNDINNNKEIKVSDSKITLKNALIKADLITISIGSNDVLEMIKYNKDVDKVIDETLDKLDELCEVIRSYSKETIVLMGYYNPFYYYKELSTKIKDANRKVKEITLKYGIIYVDVYDLFKDNTYLPNSLDVHPSKEGYQKISELMIKAIKEEI